MLPGSISDAAKIAIGFRGRAPCIAPRQKPRWWRKAAEQGNAAAQFNLGITHYNGIVVRKDDEQAAIWFSKAAAQGNAEAKNLLRIINESALNRKAG